MKDMSLQESGLLHVPIPMNKVGQILLWVSTGCEGSIPFDLSGLPKVKTPSQKGDDYYLFSSVEMVDHNFIMIFRRFVLTQDRETTPVGSFYTEAQEELYESDQIMIDPAFLKILREEHVSLQSTTSPKDFIELMRSQGFLKEDNV